jgi:hypothetical protein
MIELLIEIGAVVYLGLVALAWAIMDRQNKENIK